jgi:hypothetical protein
MADPPSDRGEPPLPGPTEDPLEPSGAGPSIVDWRRTAHRLRTSVAVIGGLVTVGWLAGVVTTGGARLALLAELVGFGLLAAFVVEVVVVGGSAVRGMLAAGARGERLASSDVTLLPPQLSRRRR